MENENKGQWFVVNTLSQHENKVKNTIERELALANDSIDVYEALIPTEQVSEVKKGKKITATKKFFPGYILIRADLYTPDGVVKDDVWHFINNIKGLMGFVGNASKPLPLSDKEVDDLMMQISDDIEKPRPKVDFKIGDMIRIKDGAFENFEGSIEEIDLDRGKLKLMVSIFGRATPVELEFWQVERS